MSTHSCFMLHLPENNAARRVRFLSCSKSTTNQTVVLLLFIDMYVIVGNRRTAHGNQINLPKSRSIRYQFVNIGSVEAQDNLTCRKTGLHLSIKFSAYEILCRRAPCDVRVAAVPYDTEGLLDHGYWLTISPEHLLYLLAFLA